MKKILVVDDDHDIVSAIEAILSMESYTLFSAYNGEDCLRLAEKEKPNLILLDYMLPDLSGKDVVEKLRSKNLTKNIPVVLISAAHGLSELCKGLSVQGVIEKPFELELLLKTVKKLTNTKNTSE